MVSQFCTLVAQLLLFRGRPGPSGVSPRNRSLVNFPTLPGVRRHLAITGPLSLRRATEHAAFGTARDIIISRLFLTVSQTRDSVGASSSAVLLFTDAARRRRRLAASRPKNSNRPGVRPGARVRVFCRFVDPLTSALHCRITPERSIAAGRGLHQSLQPDELNRTVGSVGGRFRRNRKRGVTPDTALGGLPNNGQACVQAPAKCTAKGIMVSRTHAKKDATYNFVACCTFHLPAVAVQTAERPV